MEMPNLVRLEPMPGGIDITGQQGTDGGGGRTFDGRDAALDAFLTAMGFALEAAFRMRFESETANETRGGGRDGHDTPQLC
ncbi:hypothetical protein LMG7141_01428 [Ralstonia condita]|uniref:Uncharacterized protein n=1 Tax=Ralstonia condita TaxID=3058600 RepID=A0ABM9J5Z7_9RALS|nr:hypothetical protein LMG7141_01428 [Ralstonia sp. LMG 7141]